MPENTLYSIGHSNHSIDAFIKLLRQYKIDAVADVRSIPYSRYNPQFSKEPLQQALKHEGIEYVFLGKELGARRKEPECYREGKVDYELIKETAIFQAGIERLLNGVSRMRVAMLCAEKEPLNCHRTILISTYIKDRVDNIHHILADGSICLQKEIDEQVLADYKFVNKDLFFDEEGLLAQAYQSLASGMTRPGKGQG